MEPHTNTHNLRLTRAHTTESELRNISFYANSSKRRSKGMYVLTRMSFLHESSADLRFGVRLWGTSPL